MKKLKTIHGETIIIDYEHYEKAKQYRWSTKSDEGRLHVVTYIKEEGRRKRVSYKKLILGLGSKVTLYKNDNPFDLRRDNIRVFDSRSEHTRAMNEIYHDKNPPFNINKSKAMHKKRGVHKRINKTTYIGVVYVQRLKRQWQSRIVHNWKSHHLGSFTKDEYAALAYDKKAREFYGDDANVNFPHLTIKEITKKLEKIKEEEKILFHDHFSKKHQGRIKVSGSTMKTSKYVGVSVKKKKWQAMITHHRKTYRLFGYDTEEDAALAYDKKAIELYGKDVRLNFPHLTIKELTKKVKKIEEAKDVFDRLSKSQQGKLVRKRPKTSKYVGVHFASGKKKWIAKINYRYKAHSLGEYDVEEAAARAYDKKAIELYGGKAKLNFPLK